MCFHKKWFLALDNDSCLRELAENQERYSWNLIETLLNYELGQLCLNFTVTCVYLSNK